MILAVDPGRDKVGLVLYKEGEGVLWQKILPALDFFNSWPHLLEKYAIEKIVLGQGTASDRYKKFFRKVGIKFTLVEEKDSSLEARRLYFQENPPKGLRRLVPQGLLVPPRPVDDYAARVILQRFLKRI